VIILTGKDKGKRGSVIDILPKEGKVKVKGIAIATRHVKARSQGETSMIKKEEAFIDISNVMPIDPKTDKPSRVNFTKLEDGSKARISNVSKEAF
jgi:large subunit ribosomal protein L24